jgi:hypothetical protein
VKNNLLIFGSAPCTAEDISRAQGKKDCDYMAIGMDALDKYMGGIFFVVSNHKEDILPIHKIMQQRHEACGAGYQYLVIAPEQWQGVQIVEPYRPPSGSSAITGAFAAIRMGYEKIILCGCPLTGNAPEGNSYEAFRPGWETHKEVFMGRVKSMSGWTMELLGYPTEEWLNA